MSSASRFISSTPVLSSLIHMKRETSAPSTSSTIISTAMKLTDRRKSSLWNMDYFTSNL